MDRKGPRFSTAGRPRLGIRNTSRWEGGVGGWERAVPATHGCQGEGGGEGEVSRGKRGQEESRKGERRFKGTLVMRKIIKLKSSGIEPERRHFKDRTKTPLLRRKQH